MSSEGNTIIHSTLDEGYDFFITDKWKKKYHFKISTFEVPSGLLSEAIEVIVSSPKSEPRTFQVLSDFDADIEKAEMLLKAKIKKGINQRHIKIENGELTICDDEVLRGKIGWTKDLSDTEFNTIFEIDGKRITIEKFLDLLAPYGGFNFKFKIYDPSEDID
jgi:hypothetical protein